MMGSLVHAMPNPHKSPRPDYNNNTNSYCIAKGCFEYDRQENDDCVEYIKRVLEVVFPVGNEKKYVIEGKDTENGNTKILKNMSRLLERLIPGMGRTVFRRVMFTGVF
mmetsp:Transcript_2238/g.5104  ORF Transcript_2238/g.5104 Transcript_2238/m.5104 type:complete len:108 (-) Transcript_2238:715-1038(-)